MVEQHGGAFVSDVIGLGKSYIGAAIVSHFERTERARPLIICPKPLVEMWERYNEVYQLNARVLSMSMLREGGEGAVGSLLEDVRYQDRETSCSWTRATTSATGTSSVTGSWRSF